MAKVLITPRSFGTYSKEPFALLEQAGIEIVRPECDGIVDQRTLISLIEDVDAVIAGVDDFSAEVLKHAKNLKVISKYGVGVDNIDLDYCVEHGIEVHRAVGANSEAVADYTFTLMLAVARRLCEIDTGCRNDDWSKKTAVDVYGKCLGVIGLGNIGQGVVKRACGFKMNVMAYDPYWDAAFADQYNVTKADIDTILSTCDFVTLHMPLTAESYHLINRERLEKMKPTAILINTARGGLVDEEALFELLQNGKLYGAGLDVFEVEPASHTPFKQLDNVILGSHCAASTKGAVDKMGIISTMNLLESLQKEGN